MPKQPTLTVKKLVAITPEMAEAIENFRFEGRIGSESEAIRRLIEAGLASDQDMTIEIFCDDAQPWFYGFVLNGSRDSLPSEGYAWRPVIGAAIKPAVRNKYWDDLREKIRRDGYYIRDIRQPLDL